MKYFWTWCLVGMSQLAFACDVCGSGGGYYAGYMPQFTKNFVGARYRYTYFQSHYNHTDAKSPIVHDEFRTVEVWGRYYITKRWQAMAFVPYSFNLRTYADEKENMNGLSDLILTSSYNVLNTQFDTLLRKVDHSIWLGGGVKAPTGKFALPVRTTQLTNPNFQLGTGTWDFLLTAQYTIRYKRVGLNADAAYKINTTNADAYHFGNRWSGNISAFTVQRFKQFAFMAMGGAYAEHSKSNYSHGDLVYDTGGNFVNATAGFDVYYKKIAVGVQAQTPLYQDLSNGKLTAKSRFTVQINYLF